MKRKLLFLLTTCLLVLLVTLRVTAAGSEGVQITKLDDRLRIEINGQLFTEYYFKNVPRPYYYPLLNAEGAAMTRKWPMENPSGEDHDHPHHRSLWFAHGAVNGKDFWTEEPGFGKIIHEGFDKIKSGKNKGVIRSHDKWVGADGKTYLTDDRTFTVYNSGEANEREFDFEITLHASNGEVVFGDTKEGTMAVRVAETMKLKAKPGPGGHIVESTGVKDGAAWGKRAGWCDYSGPVDGKIAGIAMFDNPNNPRYPTWWHVRDYGLFAANPFGKHDFEKLKDDKTAGDLKVAAGKSITFKYRFYIHDGDDQQAKVAERYEEYLKTAK